MTISTADLVLSALSHYRLTDKGHGRYVCDSPLRTGSDSHAFSLKIDGPERGAYYDHVSGDKGSLYTLATALGIAVPKHKVATKPEIVATYDYVDTTGTLQYQSCRLEPGTEQEKDGTLKKKTFFQRRPDGKNGWITKDAMKSVTYVLYHLPDVHQAVNASETIYIPEGEKDADLLTLYGRTATTNVGGAGKWRAEYTKALTGATVVILPDNDQPGINHAATVAQALAGVAASIKIVNLPGLPPKGDVSDWIESGHTLAELDELVQATPEYTPLDTPTGTAPTAQATGSAESATPTNSQTTPTTPTNSHELPRFTVRTEGELATLPDPSWLLTDEIQRSGYHLLYGASGSGKTFFAIDRALRAVAAGARCLYIATEDLSGLKVRTAAWRAHNKGMGGALAWLDMPHGLDLSDVTQVYDLMIAITGLDLDLITIDTLREAHTGDENSSQAMAAVNRAIQQMIRETGAAVDVVHHSGVNDGRERGSTALGANCDIKWKIAGDDGGFVTVSCEKFRHGAVFSPRYYRITPTPSVEGGAVLLPVGSTTDRGDSPLTAGQRKILEMLALSIFEEQGAKSTQIERDTGMPSSSMNRALDSLKKKGFITQGSKGDPYSITPTGRTAIRPNYQLTPTNKSASQCATPTTPTNSQTTPTDLPRTPTTPTTHRVGVGGSGSEEKKDTTHPTATPDAADLWDAPAIYEGEV